MVIQKTIIAGNAVIQRRAINRAKQTTGLVIVIGRIVSFKLRLAVIQMNILCLTICERTHIVPHR